MTKPNQILMWISAVLMMVVGFLIALKGTTTGWFLIFMGIIYISIPIKRSQASSLTDPTRERWVFLGITILSILVIAFVALSTV